MLSARTILTLLVPLLAGTQMPLHAQAAGAKTAQGAPAPATPPAGTKPAPAPTTAKPPNTEKPPVALPAGTVVPADYVIGPDDILTIVFWREKDLSSEVVVRPDGRISLPVLQDITAAGLTPEQLRDSLTKTAERFVEEPNVTVVVREIKSRRVFITGMVTKPGVYNITAPMTVVQLIAVSGGLLEYADAKNIVVMRTENAKDMSYKFNYKEVSEGKNLKQNIQLKPGDTVVVP
jgi:polysaccharide export outer membrane protein